jgi:ATP-dependent Lhr-like helicase
VAAAEGITGGFGAVYDVLKALEDTGRVRRGYFVGVGATQFALPPALELLRTLREPPEQPETLVLAATDPANALRDHAEMACLGLRTPHPRSQCRARWS